MQRNSVVLASVFVVACALLLVHLLGLVESSSAVERGHETLETENTVAFTEKEQRVSAMMCDNTFPHYAKISTEIKQRLPVLLEDLLVKSSGYRHVSIALATLGLNSDSIIGPIYERHAALDLKKAQSNGSMKFVFADPELRDDLQHILATSDFNNAIEYLKNANPSGLVYNAEYMGEVYSVSEFSIVMLAHQSVNEHNDFIESSLFASGLGLAPTAFDILFVQMATNDVTAIDHMYRELPENEITHLEDMFYRHPVYGKQNILTNSILANQFEIAEYWLSQNILSIGLGTHSIFYDISHFSSEPGALAQLSFVLQKGLMPLTKDNVRALERAFPHERLLEFKQHLTFDFKELSVNDKETVQSLRTFVLSEADNTVHKYQFNIPNKCRVQVALRYLQGIDWNNHKERYEFLSQLDEDEIENLMPSKATITSIAPSLPEDPTKTEKVEEKHWINIDADLTKEQMNTLFQAALDNDRETINSLLRKAFGEQLTQEELLFVLALAVFGKDKNLYLDTMPKVTQFPDEVVLPIIVFNDAIPILNAFREQGHDIHRVFKQQKSNLLIEAMKSDRFEIFEYLAKQGVALRTSAYVEDAFDLAVVRLARSRDWRYLDVVLQSQLDLRESNFEVISQLKQIAPVLYDQFVEKYGVLQ